MPPHAAPTAFLSDPLLVLALSVAVIVAAIAVFRLPAFFALMAGAILAGVMTAAGATGPHRFVDAVTAATAAFGSNAGKLGFTIALAAVIGVSLMESGAADKLVRRMVATIGEKNAAAALLICSFLLSAPVFADTVFMLMLPIARATALRTGKNAMLYVLAVCAGIVITNGTVPPAPGPLVVAALLKLNLGVAMAAGLVFGVLPAAAALLGARWFNARMPLEIRSTTSSSIESLQALAARPESELPGFWVAAAPIALPFALIAAASLLAIPGLHPPFPAGLAAAVEFVGDKNIALVIGAAVAIAVRARQKKAGWRIGAFLGPALQMGAIIILVVSSGSAYGEMIRHSGLDGTVHRMFGGHPINFVLLVWFITVVVRVAQGSATVAMITGIGIAASVAGPSGFGVHPLYLLLAAGYGSKFGPWMNDAGFWLVCRVGGLTQGEALRSWSVLSCGLSLLGLIEVLVVSSLFPHLPFLQ